MTDSVKTAPQSSCSQPLGRPAVKHFIIWYDYIMPSLVQNKKARLNYEILETFEAGIELLGTEVKSLRAQHGSLLGAHVVIRGGEVVKISDQTVVLEVSLYPPDM